MSWPELVLMRILRKTKRIKTSFTLTSPVFFLFQQKSSPKFNIPSSFFGNDYLLGASEIVNYDWFFNSCLASAICKIKF